MKLQAFTIMESMIVLVLSAIVFAVILNAHQLINSIYTINVNNGKTVEQVAEIERLLRYKTFSSDEIIYELRSLIFRTGDNDVTVRLNIDGSEVEYSQEDRRLKIMQYDIPVRIARVETNSRDKITSVDYELNYNDTWHTYKLLKNYTAQQKLEWIAR